MRADRRQLRTGSTGLIIGAYYYRAVSENFGAFANVQLPVYSELDGYQLFTHWTAAVGANYAI